MDVMSEIAIPREKHRLLPITVLRLNSALLSENFRTGSLSDDHSEVLKHWEGQQDMFFVQRQSGGLEMYCYLDPIT